MIKINDILTYQQQVPYEQSKEAILKPENVVKESTSASKMKIREEKRAQSVTAPLSQDSHFIDQPSPSFSENQNNQFSVNKHEFNHSTASESFPEVPRHPSNDNFGSFPSNVQQQTIYAEHVADEHPSSRGTSYNQPTSSYFYYRRSSVDNHHHHHHSNSPPPHCCESPSPSMYGNRVSRGPSPKRVHNHSFTPYPVHTIKEHKSYPDMSRLDMSYPQTRHEHSNSLVKTPPYNTPVTPVKNITPLNDRYGHPTNILVTNIFSSEKKNPNYYQKASFNNRASASIATSNLLNKSEHILVARRDSIPTKEFELSNNEQEDDKPSYKIDHYTTKDLTNSQYQPECPICHKIFKKIVHLKTHLRIHENKKPFQCQLCKLKFLRKHDLQRHEKIHAGVKPFSCKRCHKMFPRKDGLKRHENMEPAIRKFRCVPDEE